MTHEEKLEAELKENSIQAKVDDWLSDIDNHNMYVELEPEDKVDFMENLKEKFRKQELDELKFKIEREKLENELKNEENINNNLKREEEQQAEEVMNQRIDSSRTHYARSDAMQNYYRDLSVDTKSEMDSMQAQAKLDNMEMNMTIRSIIDKMKDQQQNPEKNITLTADEINELKKGATSKEELAGLEKMGNLLSDYMKHAPDMMKKYMEAGRMKVETILDAAEKKADTFGNLQDNLTKQNQENGLNRSLQLRKALGREEITAATKDVDLKDIDKEKNILDTQRNRENIQEMG